MERANRAIKRGGIKLKKRLGFAHADISLVLMELQEARATLKYFQRSQHSAWRLMAKWAGTERNIALKEIVKSLEDLLALWADVQMDLAAGFRKLKHQFKLIKESEITLDKSKDNLITLQRHESKVSNDLKKARDNSEIELAKQLARKQTDLQALIKTAGTDVDKKIVETEANKLMLMKEGLLNISSNYITMIDKGSLIFEAHKEISEMLPDVHDNRINDIKFSGPHIVQGIVQSTKRSVHSYDKNKARTENAPPPPYTSSPVPSVSSSYNAVPRCSSENSSHLRRTEYPHDFQVPQSTHHPSRPLGFSEYPIPVYSPTFYDLPATENQEDLEGAVGGCPIDINSSRRYKNV